MDNIINSKKCGNCQSELESPVLLTSGEYICQKHIIESQEFILCQKCGVEHKIERAKEINNATQNNVVPDNEVNKRNEAKKSCENFDDLLTNIDQILHDPYNSTYELITNLKNEFQLKGEEAIFRINENMKSAINKLDEYNSECKKCLSEKEYAIRSGELRLEKENGRRELEQWMATLDELKEEEDDKEAKRIKSESEKAIDSFTDKLAAFKIDLFPKSFFEYYDEIEKDFGSRFEFNPNYLFK
jgi:hypothetical protein